MIGKTVVQMIKKLSKSSYNINAISQLKHRNKAKEILGPTTQYLFHNYKKMTPYQMITIYSYFFKNSSKNAFFFVDSFLFSKLQNNFYGSLKLSSLRLLCLVYYDFPHKKWSEQVRQIFHMIQPTSTDYLLLMGLGIQKINFVSPELQNFKKQIYISLIQDLQNFDITQLIKIRKNLRNITQQSIQYEKMIQKLDRKIDSQIYRLTNFELKSLANHNCFTFNKKWFMNYVLKSYNQCWRQYGFYIILKQNQFPWKKWAIQKYGQKQIINQLPYGSQKQNKYLALTQINKFINDFNQKGQFIDLQYEILQKQGKYYLKNQQQVFSSYIEHSFNSIYSFLHRIKKDQINKISQILENIPKNTQLSINSQFKYFCLKIFFNYYFGQSQNEKELRDKEQLLQLLNRLKNNNKDLINPKQRMSLDKISKIIQSLSISLLQSEQFLEVYEYFKKMNNQWIRQHKNKNLKYYNINKMKENMIDIYNKGNKRCQQKNQIIFGDFQQYKIQGCENIKIVYNVQINEYVYVDGLVKLKNKGQQKRFFFDFLNNKKKELSRQDYLYLSFSIRWKQNYLKNWCKLNYTIFSSEQEIKQYIKQII